MLTDPASYFLKPRSPRQRQYEALRAYFVEGKSSEEVARAFGYSPGAFRVLGSHFRNVPQLWCPLLPSYPIPANIEKQAKSLDLPVVPK